MSAGAATPRWERRAAYSTTALRSVQGHLRVIRDTLVFNPLAAERVTFGRDWAAQLAEIEAVEIEPRNVRHLLSGGLGRRLALVLRDGRRALFRVDDVDTV